MFLSPQEKRKEEICARLFPRVSLRHRRQNGTVGEDWTQHLRVRVIALSLAVWVQMPTCVWLFVTPWTTSRQALLSMGFSRQEYWSGLPFPSPGDLPNPGIKPTSLMPPALAGVFFTTSTTWEAQPAIWLLKSLNLYQTILSCEKATLKNIFA